MLTFIGVQRIFLSTALLILLVFKEVRSSNYKTASPIGLHPLHIHVNIDTMFINVLYLNVMVELTKVWSFIHIYTAIKKTDHL